MASRLYPGFGSGKGTFSGVFRVAPILAAGGSGGGADARCDLECGDKIILPPSALKEISRLKLPFPLHFQMHRGPATAPVPPASTRPISGSTPGAVPAPEQYAGVYEFSAPPDTMQLPGWMMKNLGIKSGASVRVSTVRDIEPGTSVKLRPHSAEFLDVAAALGPKVSIVVGHYRVHTTFTRVPTRVL